MNTERVYIIAEAGVNHNGNRDMAMALIDSAADAGADAVKFQTFKADKLATATAPKAAYQRERTDAMESQVAMLKKLELPKAWHQEMQDRAHGRGLEFLSTPFDADSLRFLCDLGVPKLKVPSGELVNAPLLWQFARTGKPLIVSTGMATLSEVEEALAVIAHALHNSSEPENFEAAWKCWSCPESRNALRGRVTLLHCTSSYPTPPREVNLLAMDTLASTFGLPVGYSDHTRGWTIAMAAVARGACIIEKHFTLDRNLPGPDHKASLEADELARMVSEIRILEQALGDGRKAPQPTEWDSRLAARQQVVAAREIRAGQTIERADLGTARCGGNGLPARLLWDLVGRISRHDIAPGERIPRD
ncbi:MAG TPA: N-acetylneuraminate synthase [Sedimentisphaerales bacterium]|nr:N-acetylneuraminate synthase [Sedimentisphaerales bacterium]